MRTPPSTPSSRRPRTPGYDSGKRSRKFTFGQTIALAAFCSSSATILTALMAANVLYAGWDGSSRAVSTKSTHLRTNVQDRPLRATAKQSTSTVASKGPRPQVAWLMSFPNSGTSFTLHMTREASNATTATNYALEGEIRDQPSVPIHAAAAKNGPWLELIPGRHTTVPATTILTKTHCKGFCSGQHCGPSQMIHTVRSFMMGCLSGTKAVATDRGLAKVKTTYGAHLVSKAIHIFRHPLDNIVARFHLDYNVQKAAGNVKFTQVYPKNAIGFWRWCANDDQNRGLLSSRFIDHSLRRALEKVPCFNEFYRYVQWHNLAFSTTADMNLTTMILHYHEYSDDFEKARDKVLDFLELPLTGTGIEFHDGKVYRHYYSKEQKLAIRGFIEQFASHETWEQLRGYDFEIEDDLVASS